MNTQKLKKVTLLIAIAIMIIGTSAYAQRGRNFNDNERGFGRQEFCQRIPDLTEDQQTKIEALRTGHLKEMTAYRNQMNEFRAKKHTLMTSDNGDMKEINSVIDQMTGVHNKMMKASAKHRQDVRNLLTDDQKVYFDARPMYRRGNGKGMGRAGRGQRNYSGYGRGQGQGYDQGQGLGYGRGAM